MTLLIKDNEFLKDWAKLAGVSIEFKDATMLPGTAWIAGLPIDIAIYKGYLVLNAVGEFGGTAKTLAKSKNKGRRLFQPLYQYLPNLLKKYGLGDRIYLTPLSPVWEKNYKLVEATEPLKGHWYFLQVEQPDQSQECQP
jgi:hypothetical protein